MQTITQKGRTPACHVDLIGGAPVVARRVQRNEPKYPEKSPADGRLDILGIIAPASPRCALGARCWARCPPLLKFDARVLVAST